MIKKKSLIIQESCKSIGDSPDTYILADKAIKGKLLLALALGLADEVQSSAGGIQLGTMFVDEGFGSLDEEFLDQAVQALVNLTQGNKLVRIISHEASLRDKVNRKIVVKKKNPGEVRYRFWCERKKHACGFENTCVLFIISVYDPRRKALLFFRTLLKEIQRPLTINKIVILPRV